MTTAFAPLLLVVDNGIDLGKTLALTPGASYVIGRGREADLCVLDPRVSRRHLLAVVDDAAHVVFRVLDNAAPITHGAVVKTEARLGPGDELLVGDSRLRVVAVARPEPEAPGSAAAATDLGVRMTGARSFAALVALSAALDGADDEEAIESLVAHWLEGHLGATGVAVELVTSPSPSGVPAPAVQVQSATSGGTRVALDARGRDGAALRFVGTLPDPLDDLPAELPRMLELAGRLCAAAFLRARREQSLAQESAMFRDLALGSAASFLGDSESAKTVAKLIPRLASTDSTALLLGETGTGKSFVARLIHEAGPRSRHPFRVLNAAAVPESLFEATLFGHEKGAFTGAAKRTIGALESAGRGTLFLDEIGEMPLATQAKLLRALDDRRFERVGSNETLSFDARILTATNRDLQALVKEGRFRADLYFRLSVVTVVIPPLRERRADIPMLAHQVLRDLSNASGRRIDGIAPDALAELARYGWPGNVRELKNVLERAIVLGDGVMVRREDLPDTFQAVTASPAAEKGHDDDVVRLPILAAELERLNLHAALRRAGGNITRASTLLGIGRATIYKRLAAGERSAPPGAEEDDG